MSEAFWAGVLPVAITVIGGGTIAIVRTLIKRNPTPPKPVAEIMSPVSHSSPATGVFASAMQVKGAIARIKAIEIAVSADRLVVSALSSRAQALEIRAEQMDADFRRLRDMFEACERDRRIVDLRIERELGAIGATLESALENDR